KAATSLPHIPKVGMQMAIARPYDYITFYGKGPMENYIDRRYGFDAGIYSMPLNDFMEPYIYPQENGNRTDVRWMAFGNKDREGIMVVADSLLSMGAWPFTQEEILSKKHWHELVDSKQITVNIDLIQMGVGGNDSWSEVSQ